MTAISEADDPRRQRPASLTHRSFHFNRRSYEWRQVGQNWELTTGGQVVAQIIPDALHPGMYRVDLGDDPLSDMVNLTRAKDAALSLADRALERRWRQRSQGASPISETDPALISPHLGAPASPRASHGGGSPTRLPPDVQSRKRKGGGP